MPRHTRSEVSPSSVGTSVASMRWIRKLSTDSQSAAISAEAPVIAIAAATTNGFDCSVGLRGLVRRAPAAI